MRFILLSVMFVFTGCVSVPNKLVVLPEILPEEVAKSVRVVIDADNETVNEGFGRYLIKALKAKGIDARLSLNANLKNRLVLHVNDKKVRWFAYSDGTTNYYTLKDRLELYFEMYSENQIKSYFSMEIALDSELEGLNMKGYKKKENIAYLIRRAAKFISKVYLSVEKKSVAIEGRWESLLGSSVISINAVNNKYSGSLVKASETTFSFKSGDEAYRINMPLTRGKGFSELGSMLVKYLKGSSEWIPAKYSIYGCLLIIDPVSESAPVGKSFFYKDCHK